MAGTEVSYALDDRQRFVVEDYNWATSFSNFFPGIAGPWGIPVWCYYVSRHQGICSMGVHDKHHQILEFLSFNKALAQVGRIGFRTFLRLEDGSLYEPYRKVRDAAVHQRMVVSSGELQLEERNDDQGLSFRVTYFPLVESRVPALVRRLELTNDGPAARRVELVDGLPHVFPHGVDIDIITTIPRHIEGMMTVAEHRGVPLFRLKQTPGDVEQVARLEGGNFYAAGVRAPSGADALGTIVDPAVLFGEPEVYDHPWVLEQDGLAGVLAGEQIRQNRTPCAFATAAVILEPGETATVEAFLGYVEQDDQLDRLLDPAAEPGFVDDRRAANERLMQGIKDLSLTVTDSPLFDEYCHQTFLDNVIRGGMPMVFDTAEGPSAFYLYSRQNGDLERDYHYVKVEATYLSQGTGHYRSVLQNRRCDTWYFPEIGDFNVRLFTSLTQLDSYSPLEVLGSSYTVVDEAAARGLLEGWIDDEDDRAAILRRLTDRFTPGEIVMALEAVGGASPGDREERLRGLLALSEENEVGDRLHLGFWIDHWCYNLDTIDVFEMVFPDRLGELLLGHRAYTFYDNPDRVRPRADKIVEHAGRVRQYDAVFHDEEKDERIATRGRNAHRVRTEGGDGPVYRTHLLAKLLCLVVNRVATLDPVNVGVEMEANKPGWNDSMSAVAGIFGSSVGQAFEVARACRWLDGALERLFAEPGSRIGLFEELAELLEALSGALERRLRARDAGVRELRFWDESHRLKEAYRERVRFGVSGAEAEVPVEAIRTFLQRSLALFAELETPGRRELAFHPSGVPYTYLSFDVPRSEPRLDADGRPRRSERGLPLVRPLAFEPRPIALFLEGPVHYLKAWPERGGEVYRPIKDSDLYDRQLQMYKVCASLKQETFEIGRVHAWGSGWIENESVYTHMEYKYLLELLRSRQYAAFFEDIRTGLTCFLPHEVYGRSPFENVSFVVSSAFVDRSMHGRGLQPRLSGVTNEMLHIWILMMAGHRPFGLDGDGALTLTLAPLLPGWLFTRGPREVTVQELDGGSRELGVPADSLAFRFLGRCLVLYRNPSRRDTCGPDAARPTGYRVQYVDGREVAVEGDTLTGPIPADVREGRVSRIEVELGRAAG